MLLKWIKQQNIIQYCNINDYLSGANFPCPFLFFSFFFLPKQYGNRNGGRVTLETVSDTRQRKRPWQVSMLNNADATICCVGSSTTPKRNTFLQRPKNLHTHSWQQITIFYGSYPRPGYTLSFAGTDYSQRLRFKQMCNTQKHCNLIKKNHTLDVLANY